MTLMHPVLRFFQALTLGLLLFAGSAFAQPAPLGPDGEVVTYTSLDGTIYQMYRFNGKWTTNLFEKEDLDKLGIAAVRKLVDEHDILYEAMKEFTGQEPSLTEPLKIAFVNASCGGGCAWGGNNLEILKPILYADDYMQYLTHEMLHNFDKFSGFLFNGDDPAHTWTAFADHYVPYFLNKGELGLNARDMLIYRRTEKLALFANYPGATWQSCIVDVACDPVGPMPAKETSLYTQAGVVLRIGELYGRVKMSGLVPTMMGLVESRGVPTTAQQKTDLL